MYFKHFLTNKLVIIIILFAILVKVDRKPPDFNQGI